MGRKTLSAPAPSPDHIALIDSLGGPTAVAEAVSRRLGIAPPLTPQSVSMWKVRGIPWRYRAMLAIMAREDEVSCPPGFLGEPTPQQKPAAGADDLEEVPGWLNQ